LFRPCARKGVLNRVTERCYFMVRCYWWCLRAESMNPSASSKSGRRLEVTLGYGKRISRADIVEEQITGRLRIALAAYRGSFRACGRPIEVILFFVAFAPLGK
jgi:hypothetical protein